MKREEAINQILDEIPKDSLVISSTGKISRELFELRQKRNEPTNDFYMMGSMGCALAIGIGLAASIDEEIDVYVLDGDGAILMKLGSLATKGKYAPANLKHIIFNNNAHNSTGGQPTAFSEVREMIDCWSSIVEVEKGSRADLGRIPLSPETIKRRFSDKVRS